MNDTDNNCPYLANCPMFQHFNETAKVVFKEFYCLGDYANTCQRYKLRQAGQPVPADMFPYDKINTDR